MNRNILAVTAAALVLSCRAPTSGVRDLGTGAPALEPAQISASTLGTGDLLEVRVFQETDLSGPFRVSPEGTIDYPLCGKVAVAGKTPSGASDALTGCLKQGFLKSPQVTVLVREYNSKKVFVIGEVQKPGTFAFEDNMSIIQAVSLAGGFTRSAARNNVNITRIVEGREQKTMVKVEDISGGRERNVLLQPGDIVFVPESFF